MTGIANTGYIINTLAIGKLSVPQLSFNAPFSNINNANSNFAYSTRQVQIGAKFNF